MYSFVVFAHFSLINTLRNEHDGMLELPWLAQGESLRSVFLEALWWWPGMCLEDLSDIYKEQCRKTIFEGCWKWEK